MTDVTPDGDISQLISARQGHQAGRRLHLAHEPHAMPAPSRERYGWKWG